MARPRRPRLAAVLVLFVVALLGVTAWIGARAVLAQRHLTAARADLTAAREALVGREVDRARAAIAAAGERTSRARDLTSDPVWRLAGAVPGYGATLTATQGIAAASDDLARQVLPQALAAAEALDPSALRGPDGAIDLTVVRAAGPSLQASAATSDRVREDVAALPTDYVAGPVADALGELREQLDDLATTLVGASRALELAPALLGEDRPRRYFVLVQQNAESRGTGGLPGGFAILEAAGGRLSVPVAGSRQELGSGALEVPAGVPELFVNRYRRYGTFDFLVNINVSPDLPVVSRLIAQRWRQDTGQQIDGVIALDAQALSMVLAGSGPIAVEGREVQPEELPEYLAVGQYRDFAAPVGSARIDLTRQRKDALSDVAAETARRVASGGGSSQALLTGLSRALRSGHLRMASDDPALGPALADAGITGALPSAASPVAYPVVFNSTGGKLDTFLDRAVTYDAGECDDDERDSRIEVTLTNAAPAEALPDYLRLRDDGQRVVLSSDNAVTLSVYTTAGARLRGASLDGVALDAENPDAALVERFVEGEVQGYTLFMDLPRLQPRTLVLDLTEPVLPGPVQVPVQPLARPLQVTVEAPVC